MLVDWQCRQTRWPQRRRCWSGCPRSMPAHRAHWATWGGRGTAGHSRPGGPSSRRGWARPPIAAPRAPACHWPDTRRSTAPAARRAGAGGILQPQKKGDGGGAPTAHPPWHTGIALCLAALPQQFRSTARLAIVSERGWDVACRAPPAWPKSSQKGGAALLPCPPAALPSLAAPPTPLCRRVPAVPSSWWLNGCLPGQSTMVPGRAESCSYMMGGAGRGPSLCDIPSEPALPGTHR